MVNNIITWRRRWCASPGLLDRSLQPPRWIGGDLHRRTEKAKRNYSSATSLLSHRLWGQENQAAEEPRSSIKT
jgi:hypothetical protein